jgi:DNA modification methylase
VTKLTQQSLFTDQENIPGVVDEAPDQVADFGTFKDSLRAPIHSWFRYPAGYSYKLVEKLFRENSITVGDWIYDPFSGTGTTLICAKQQGINSYGVEAHAFVHWVAGVKLHWEFDFKTLPRQIESLIAQAMDFVQHFAPDEAVLGKVFPELVYKCYHPRDLFELYTLREFITQPAPDAQTIDEPLRNLFKLALTDTLRNAAAAGTGWPYIAPRKNTGDKPPKKAAALFRDMLRKMAADLKIIHSEYSLHPKAHTHNMLGDSRQPQALEDGQVGFILTSPPYLNNYDYADRTRLETYFWGIAKSWKEITTQFRDKLITAATTQVVRSRYEVEHVVSATLRARDAQLYNEIQSAVRQLAERRLTKGGKKDYDLMVGLYFNDMLQVLQECFRVLKPGGKFCLVLGDSAPYGVHIPTETFIGRLGLALGFKSFDYQEFRVRGGKWKANPQRHNIPLREGILTLAR